MDFTDEKAWKYARRDAQEMKEIRNKEYNSRNSNGVLLDPFGEHGTTYEESVRCSISNAMRVLGV